jgi:hypothetical protein
MYLTNVKDDKEWTCHTCQPVATVECGPRRRTRLAMQLEVGVLQVQKCCRNRGVVSVYAVIFDGDGYGFQEFAVNSRSGPRDAETDSSHDRDKEQLLRLKVGAKDSSWERGLLLETKKEARLDGDRVDSRGSLSGTEDWSRPV